MPDAMVAVTHSPGASYADAAAVRRLVLDAVAAVLTPGADVDDATWNPLGTILPEGGRIHVLPNFVSHRRSFEKDEHTFLGKVTHAAVLQPILALACRAAGQGGRVSVGNAPIQGCDYPRVVAETGLAAVLQRMEQSSPPIELVDLRGIRSRWTATGALLAQETTDEELVAVDLGEHSLLEPLYAGGSAPRFRVGDYAGSETEAYHGRGRHVYMINRRVLDADLIISVPKLKTHEKVGITCVVKGAVGAIGRKECLAHHRAGGSAAGGDEFRGNAPLQRAMSAMLEVAAEQPISMRGNLLRIAGKSMFRAVRLLDPAGAGGAWSGNDTAWRMAVDIARVLRFARPDGSLADTPQRQHVAVVDGIVSGEGTGPLRPAPRDSAVVIAGADAAAVDWACALLMGADPARIPIVREAFASTRYPLTEVRPDTLRFVLNGKHCAATDLAALLPPHVLPPGWTTAARTRAVPATATP